VHAFLRFDDLATEWKDHFNFGPRALERDRREKKNCRKPVPGGPACFDVAFGN
jgi:hypothetical protein